MHGETGNLGSFPKKLTSLINKRGSSGLRCLVVCLVDLSSQHEPQLVVLVGRVGWWGGWGRVGWGRDEVKFT